MFPHVCTYTHTKHTYVCVYVCRYVRTCVLIYGPIIESIFCAYHLIQHYKLATHQLLVNLGF